MSGGRTKRATSWGEWDMNPHAGEGGDKWGLHCLPSSEDSRNRFIQGRTHPSSALFYPPSSHVLDSCFQCKKGQPSSLQASQPRGPLSQPAATHGASFPTSQARSPMVFVDSSGSYLRAIHACMRAPDHQCVGAWQNGGFRMGIPQRLD